MVATSKTMILIAAGDVAAYEKALAAAVKKAVEWMEENNEVEYDDEGNEIDDDALEFDPEFNTYTLEDGSIVLGDEITDDRWGYLLDRKSVV